jgi:hypothetical protein
MNPCPLQQMGQLRLQLLCPSLNTSCLCCVVDSRNNYFQNSLIGGLQPPLHNFHVWSSVCLDFKFCLLIHTFSIFCKPISIFMGSICPLDKKFLNYIQLCVYYSSCLKYKTSYSLNSRRRGGRTRECYPNQSVIYKTLNRRRVECQIHEPIEKISSSF